MAPAIISAVLPDQLLIIGIVFVTSVCSLLLTVVVCACCSPETKEKTPKEPHLPWVKEPTGQVHVPVEQAPATPASKSIEASRSVFKQSAPLMGDADSELPPIDQAVSFQLMSYDHDQSMGLLPGKAADMPSLQLMAERSWHSQRANAQEPSPESEERSIIASQSVQPSKKAEKAPVESSGPGGKTIRSWSVGPPAASAPRSVSAKDKHPAPVPPPPTPVKAKKAPSRVAPTPPPADLAKPAKSASSSSQFVLDRPLVRTPKKEKKETKDSLSSWRARGTPMGIEDDFSLGPTSETEENVIDKTTAEQIV